MSVPWKGTGFIDKAVVESSGYCGLRKFTIVEKEVNRNEKLLKQVKVIFTVCI